MITLVDYLVVSATLFAIGVVGVIARRNIFIMFMSIELILNAVNLSFAAAARAFGTIDGQVIVFLVIAVAAAEAALGLAIVILIFRNRATLDVDEFSAMKE